MARELGFDNINMDLIMGLPEENMDDVRRTLEEVKGSWAGFPYRPFPGHQEGGQAQHVQGRVRRAEDSEHPEMIELSAACAREMVWSPIICTASKNMAGNF